MTQLRFRRIRFQQLEDRCLLAVTGMEQEAIYLLNRARHDPAAYAQEQNLTVALSSVVARGPLAVNSALSNSADAKTTDMAVNNYFGHVGPNGVQANQLARDADYPLPSFYPNNQNFIESIAAGDTQPDDVLNRLIVDADVPGALHRQQLLAISDFYQPHREIGISHLSDPATVYQNYWVIHTAERAEPTNHLTGVVFADADGDRRYDSGEGLGGVTITINSGQVVTTNNAGGWSAVVAPGVHTVVARGGLFEGSATATTTVTTENVAVDFISGEVTSDVTFQQQFATNPVNRFDVNNLDGVTALDALQVVNFLRRQASGSLASELPLFLDVNQENDVTALDALQVINELSRLGTEPEVIQISRVSQIVHPSSLSTTGPDSRTIEPEQTTMTNRFTDWHSKSGNDLRMSNFITMVGAGSSHNTDEENNWKALRTIEHLFLLDQQSPTPIIRAESSAIQTAIDKSVEIAKSGSR